MMNNNQSKNGQEDDRKRSRRPPMVDYFEALSATYNIEVTQMEIIVDDPRSTLLTMTATVGVPHPPPPPPSLSSNPQPVGAMTPPRSKHHQVASQEQQQTPKTAHKLARWAEGRYSDDTSPKKIMPVKKRVSSLPNMNCMIPNRKPLKPRNNNQNNDDHDDFDYLPRFSHNDSNQCLNYYHTPTRRRSMTTKTKQKKKNMVDTIPEIVNREISPNHHRLVCEALSIVSA